MISISPSLEKQFIVRLGKKEVPKNEQALYRKWLRYYLDFCQKYHFPPNQEKSLSRFLGKLQEKKQTKTSQEQASQAVSLYYDLIRPTRRKLGTLPIVFGIVCARRF